MNKDTRGRQILSESTEWAWIQGYQVGRDEMMKELATMFARVFRDENQSLIDKYK